jgi:hypothetical protein
MKKLRKYMNFDWVLFFGKMSLLFIDGTPLLEKDGETMRTIGTKVRLFIYKDATDYGAGEIGLNQGETVTVKVLGVSPDAFREMEYMKSECKISDVTKATVFGDFSDRLSIIGNVKPTQSPKINIRKDEEK